MKCPKCGSHNVELKDFYEDGALTEQWYECQDCEETGDKYDFAEQEEQK